MSTARLANVEDLTKGAWFGIYGSDGYDVIGDTSSIPSYATVTYSNNTSFSFSANATWSLQKASDHSTRQGTIYFHNNSPKMKIDVALTSTRPVFISLYCHDFDGSGRDQTINVLDVDNSNAIIATYTLQYFASTGGGTYGGGGCYVIFECSGHVAFEFTMNSGTNSVVSGLFFDANAPTGTSYPTTQLADDTATQGSWVGVYGSNGQIVPNDTTSLPSQIASATNTGGTLFSFANPSTDAKALTKPSNHSARISSCWFAASQQYVDISINSPGGSFSLAAYFWDADNSGRGGIVRMYHVASKTLLGKREKVVSHFATPVWLLWNNITCNVRLLMDTTNGANFVLTGLMFDASITVTPNLRPPTPTFPNFNF